MLRAFALTAALGAAAIFYWNLGLIYPAMGIPPIFAHAAIGLFAVILVRYALRQLGLWFSTRKLLTPTGVYGRGRIARARDVVRMGLASVVGPDSFIFGAVGPHLLHYAGLSHITIIAPNNGGKTESLGITNALHIGHNLVVTDKGGEIARRTFQHRANQLGQSVAVINPWNIEGLPNHCFNPLQEVVEKVRRGETDYIDILRAIMLLVIVEEKQGGENGFFPRAARDLLVWLVVALAHWEAETGELVCNLPHLYDIVCGSQDDIELWLHRMAGMDGADGLIAKAAGRLRSRLANAPKTFENVLAEAQNGLAIFDRVGPLGRSMETSDFDPSALKRLPMSIYIAVPPDKLHGAYSPWVGLVVDALLRAGIGARTLEPRITYLLDEFANLSPTPLPSILPALYIGRSYGVRVVTMVQDRRSYERYGPEASAFISQAELTIVWGIRDLADAEWTEKRSGQKSVMTETASVPFGAGRPFPNGSFSMGASEKGLPVISKDQALSLPPYTAIVFYKNEIPIVVDLVSYRSIDPLASQAAALEGDKFRPKLPIRFKL